MSETATETVAPKKTRKERDPARSILQRIARLRSNVDRHRRHAEKVSARYQKALKQLETVEGAFRQADAPEAKAS